ncbi:MAG: hypothetical protein A2Z97_06715 [Bdellovibrionales bacterium GWB1_52_6]|nr:MAG: hypothetical protein A2Z97_06715 [Bdellovibrionales bacterium GWB1_52_6]
MEDINTHANDNKCTFASEAGFQELYLKFKKPITAYLKARVADAETAEDIAQEVFLKVYRFRGSYDPRYAPSTWLWSIAKNTLIDWFRREELTDHVGLAIESVDYEKVPCLAHDAERRLIDCRGKDVLVKMISDLSEVQRKALAMRVVDHWPYRQIAKHLNLSLSAVKCLVHRAKATLIRRRAEEQAQTLPLLSQ